MIRIFDDAFEDGVDMPPKSRSFESARDESLYTNDDKGPPVVEPGIHSELSIWIGQLWTHEVMLTEKAQVFPEKRKGGFNCCPDSSNPTLMDLVNRNYYCFPIKVRKDDRSYKGNVQCINFIRSLKSLTDCRVDISPLPINFHTPYLDAELIYNQRALDHLASNNGKFNVNNVTTMVNIFAGYDIRSIQLPGLFFYLNLFAKFHNLLIDEFRRLRSLTMTENAIRFEVRKICTGVYQKIFLDYVLSTIRKIVYFFN